MERRGPENIRADTLIAALIYLMTRYARTGSPGLAPRIAQHMQWLAAHPDSGPALRDICAGLHGAWSRTEQAPSRDGEPWIRFTDEAKFNRTLVG